ncbi:hypothetical protein STCU_12141 [Strigomonas culicis]|uniref:Uncharacterized protein n=1 Tax=Strigomonas culicis TaxID=28005 RepID=S9UXN2_9TRYP|nr:hypothetical protein STCU_12141 [Strigomonas culicis]|eukprot:EPY15300.1 hypothetical protein STCU_12141 [Strigomonas culicis]
MPPVTPEHPYAIRFTPTAKMADVFRDGAAAVEVRALLEKWGVIGPSAAPAGPGADPLTGAHWGLQSFRFSIQSEDGAAQTAPRFPYHEGLAPLLLGALLQSEAAVASFPAALQTRLERAGRSLGAASARPDGRRADPQALPCGLRNADGASDADGPV